MRVHPIAKVGLLLIAFRLMGLLVRYVVESGGSLVERLALFAPAVSMHVGALVIVVSLFLLAAAWLPRWRRPIAILACAAFALLMIVGEADLTVAAITGAPLTPTVFRTFRGVQVVTSNEFLEPLRANLGVTGGGAVLFAGVLVWMARLLRRDRGGAASPGPATHGLAGLAIGAALLGLPALTPWAMPPPPIEAAFVREYLGLDRVVLGEPERDAIRELRAAVGLPPHARWLGDEYPLVYGWTDSGEVQRRRRANPPDIVVVMVESLRAAELAFVTGTGDSVAPNLDALARRSVVFPAFISNGFPSAPSVFAFHASAWPHRRKEIITDFTDRRFDSIPARLRDLGYEAIYVGADPHFDNQARWLARWYSTAIDLVASGVTATDRNIVARGIEEIARHDAASPRRPLFVFISTYSTHYPFRMPADAGEPAAPTSADLQTMYRQVLKYTDRAIGTLLRFLETRSRRDRTVTIVVGDHSFYTDLRQTSGLPENDNEWTAALIAGPDDLVGPPRRIVGPASHVDMLPTVLALVGDDRPSAALGTDLLGAPRSGRRSTLAVRPGGLRFDRDGYSVIVDARRPTRAETRVAFPGLLAPGPRPPTAEVEAWRLTNRVNTWSYLIENNRVWTDAFLHSDRRSNTLTPTSR